MERYMRTDTEAKRNGRSDSDRHGVERQGLRGNSYERDDHQPWNSDLAESDGLGRSEPRYERFEPVTVSAAARVLLLQRARVVSVEEAHFYLHELAAMDRHASPGAYPSLLRLAQSRLATGGKERAGSAQSHLSGPRSSAILALA